MLKKLVLLLAAFVLTMSAAFAASIDVNSADQATLETLKGIGPVKSKAIIDERTKNGPFKNADDLAHRVKGLGEKSVAKLEGQGLTIGGSSAPPTAASAKGEKASPAPVTTQSSGKAPQSAPRAATAQTQAQAPTASGAQESKTKTKKKGKAKQVSAASAASGG
ncbi:competence protein ComE [Trinickia dabaoshanensis]|uniref:Competence protein ComE n=1 Tax=Trinickia dabaoshanensis TaxID=564714 RepID=A0A2N7W3A0_9BURK|nr:helix-hairpin-helix domain-containing protein [Trinickia dabaoshanensis]PMS23891.1 competence protein ComE [Trinickia dabaoshanensis]